VNRYGCACNTPGMDNSHGRPRQPPAVTRSPHEWAAISTGPGLRPALWRHEAARAGWPAVVTPLVMSVAVPAFAAAMMAGSATHEQTMRMLVGWLEVGLPLTAGIGGASLVGRDPAVELQLSMPTGYAVTLLRRLAVTVGWPALLALAGNVILLATGWWPAEYVAGESVLVWAAPLLLLGMLGAFLAVWLRNAAAASGLVAAVWLVQLLFSPLFVGTPVLRELYLFPTSMVPGMPGWGINRLVLLVAAAALLLGTCALLSRPHRLLAGEDA